MNLDDLIVRPLLGADGTVAALVCTHSDDVARTELATRLRDPLTMIVAMLDPLQTSTEDASLLPREDIQRLVRSVRRMERMLGGAMAERKPDERLEALDGQPAPHDGKRPRVLIAEDNEDLCAYLVDMLEDDWAIEIAHDGNRALECAMRELPDLLIADVTMPELDGCDLTRALRGNPRTAHVPVLIATARAPLDARKACTDAGADDYIVKPFSVRELRARAQTLIELTRSRNAAIHRATSLKDDFLSVIGHELRNPLSALYTTLQALSLRGTSPEVVLMERAVRHLTRLVDDLLESARLSRGIITLHRKPIELAQIVDRALELIAPEHDNSQKLVVSVPRTGVRVEADREPLARAIGNLVMNALQHSAPGARISIDCEQADARVKLRITDSGSGIAPERLGSVFDTFHDAEAPRKSGGLGLGLTIARGLVELHGGSIALSSPGLEQGTTCTLELMSTSSTISEPAGPARATPRRLLLVEDNDDAGRALKSALELLGYEVALAHNGPIALNLARSFHPDVALLDLGLPVMDGWELARRLRATARELPIVAVTAKDQEADKLKSAEIGFAEHLVKPINLRRLAQIVETLPPRLP